MFQYKIRVEFVSAKNNRKSVLYVLYTNQLMVDIFGSPFTEANLKGRDSPLFMSVSTKEKMSLFNFCSVMSLREPSQLTVAKLIRMCTTNANIQSNAS